MTCIGIYLQLCSLAMQTRFYGDTVECWTSHPGSEFLSPPGSGMKKFFFACYIHNKPKALIGQCTYFLINIYYYFIYPTQFILIAGGMVLHRRVTTKVRTEVPSITRLCRDMTERLLKYNNVVLFFTK